MKRLAPYLKAITGAGLSGLGAAKLALSDDRITSAEWIVVATAAIAGLAMVWAIPNKDPMAEHQDESVQPPEAS